MLTEMYVFRSIAIPKFLTVKVTFLRQPRLHGILVRNILCTYEDVLAVLFSPGVLVLTRLRQPAP